jgi:hypothetical protein
MVLHLLKSVLSKTCSSAIAVSHLLFEMKPLLTALFLFFLQFNNCNAHPLHVSIVNVDVVMDSNLVKYSVRLFYDDFQSLINAKYNTMLDFNRQNRMTFKEQQSIKDYINSALSLTDENLVTLQSELSGWKVENMSIWFYFSSKLNKGTSSLQIENKLMNDLFMDQKNLLIIRYSGIETGFEFNQRTTKQTISIY